MRGYIVVVVVVVVDIVDARAGRLHFRGFGEDTGVGGDMEGSVLRLSSLPPLPREKQGGIVHFDHF